MSVAAAERARKYRARIRQGLTLIRLELRFEDVDQLIERGLLAAWDDKDPEAIAEAVLRALRSGPASRVTGGLDSFG